MSLYLEISAISSVKIDVIYTFFVLKGLSFLQWQLNSKEIINVYVLNCLNFNSRNASIFTVFH